MQEQIFWYINCILNDMIIELLPFLTLKIKDKYKKYKYLIYTAINIFDLIAFWDPVPTLISNTIFLIMPLIITTVFFQDVLWKKILLSINYIIIPILCEFLSFFYMYKFLNGTFETDVLMRTAKYYEATTFNNMLYFIFILLAVTLWKYFIDKEKDKHFFFFLAISLYQLVLVGIFSSFSEDYSITVMWIGLLLVIMNFAVDMIVFFFMKQLEKKQLVEAELVQLYNSYNQELAHYKNIEIQLKKLREQRHEFANQMHTVTMMIEQKVPPVQIEQYLSDIINTLT